MVELNVQDHIRHDIEYVSNVGDRNSLKQYLLNIEQ